MAKYTYLGGSTADFNKMIQRFGVVTVMNADVYPVEYSTSESTTKTPEEILDSRRFFMSFRYIKNC